MEARFQTSRLDCLKEVLREVRNTEQTQELRLSEDMPDIGRVLGAWGQVILRGKEWSRDSISMSAGLQIWVLYLSEGEETLQRVETWMPFQMRWDIPENTPEGQIRIQCLPRFLDARNVSARKIMVRAGASALAEVLAPMTVQVSRPENLPEDVELLQSVYPLCLPAEAGEISFRLEEDLTVPDSAPVPEKLLSYRLEPEISDQKVLSDKLVFRGSGKLHVLYESEEGQLHSWDFEIPLSQYAHLQTGHSADARPDVLCAVTALDLEPDEEGTLHLKAGMAAQYRICDVQMAELVEDAYSPLRELGVEKQMLELPAILDNRRETIYGELTIPAEANLIVDAEYLRDFPCSHPADSGVTMGIPGVMQILYYDKDGKLRTARQRWEGKHSLSGAPGIRVGAMPLPASEPQIRMAADQMSARVEQPLQLTSWASQGLPMVSGLELGELRDRERDRPSLILRRAGEQRLWDVAKQTGSTVARIKEANALQEEPAPDRMLLIPVI